MHIPPQLLKQVHFVGIGGIGMSGIAEILHSLGYLVQGSDMAESQNVKRLKGKGINIFVGHSPENIGQSDVVVISSAVKENNPEVLKARSMGIPVIHRSEMLAEIMRLRLTVTICGSHGKTTTTSLMATLFDHAGMDPTVINGGIINSYESNARLGGGQWVVVEGDESDGSFTRLPTTIAVITNIDPEHMDHYRDFDDLKGAFKTFASSIPFYGLAVMCYDHPEVHSLIQQIHDRHVITYGLSEGADIRAFNIRMSSEGATFDVEMSDRSSGKRHLSSLSASPVPRMIKDLFLPMVGEHNVQNALSCIAVAQELGFSDDVMRKALQSFNGVLRRFTKTGEVGGVTIIDDYAHHPVEIATVIKGARKTTSGRVICVIQPHRYTRLGNLFEDFATCCAEGHYVFVVPVHSAGEQPIEGVTSEKLVEKMKSNLNIPITYVESMDDLLVSLKGLLQPKDILLCMGAGSITQWSYALPERLRSLLNEGVF